MADLFQGLDPDAATAIAQLSRLMYELRENRKLVLSPYGVDDEEALLAAILAGTVAEHPGYEHYLSARTLGDTHALVRRELTERLRKEGRP